MKIKGQKGAHTVEFAVVGSMFFVLLFAAIEFGRLVFTWNTLDEMSRRGARIAVVCPINHSAISRVALFEGIGTEHDHNYPILPGLSADNVRIEYLNESGVVLGNPVDSYLDIAFVRLVVSKYRYHLIIPMLVREFELPPIATVLPRESLGVSAEGISCFGEAG